MHGNLSAVVKTTEYRPQLLSLQKRVVFIKEILETLLAKPVGGLFILHH